MCSLIKRIMSYCPAVHRRSKSPRPASPAAYRSLNELINQHWELRRDSLSFVRDLASIHEHCMSFFDMLDTGALVYVHGSFSRGLQKDSSDVNMFIPSHSRACLEETWSASNLRQPMYEDPSVGESIENHLRDILGREVTICCSDDPWWWVERDIKFEIYPALDKNFPNGISATSDSRSRSLSVVRKCWYDVRWIEAKERQRSTLRSERIDPPSPTLPSDTCPASPSTSYLERSECIAFWKMSRVAEWKPSFQIRKRLPVWLKKRKCSSRYCIMCYLFQMMRTYP